MKIHLSQVLHGSLLCCSLAALTCSTAVAQESSEPNDQGYRYADAAFEVFDTLDQIRGLNTEQNETLGLVTGVPIPKGSAILTRAPVTVTYPNANAVPGRAWRKESAPRDAALQKVQEIQAMLAAGGDREKGEKQLREALQDYFVADMQYRVRELDDIKAKIKETEANLQKRLDAKEESIDLQVKLMLQEADGLSVFGQPSRTAAHERSRTTPIGLPNGPTSFAPAKTLRSR